MEIGKIYFEGQQVQAQYACVSYLVNQPGTALLDISGEKTKFVWAYVGYEDGEEVALCYKNRLKSQQKKDLKARFGTLHRYKPEETGS